MKKVVFIFVLSLGFAWNCHAQTWTFIQDSNLTYCGPKVGTNTCSTGIGNVLPTVAGSIWIVRAHTKNNVTIASVTGGGGSWQLCPASSCHMFNSTTGDNQDLAYNLTGNAGTTNVTITLSGNSSGFFGGNFIEILPPSGSTASFDTAGTVMSSSCNPCNGVGLSLSATDAVVQVLSGTGASAWNSWSAPYITDYANDGIGLNFTSGAAPTVAIKGAAGNVSAIAFKSSLGSFTPPPPGPISLVNYTVPNKNGISCNPSCNVTIPSTGSGHLLFIMAATISGATISSVSGGGSWVVPGAAQANQSGHAVSAAYNLSVSSGITSLTITMTGGGGASFAISELSSSGGPFVFDTAAAGTNAGSFNPSGQPLTITGTDVVFQSIGVGGGTSGASWYPQAVDGTDFWHNNGGTVELLNVTTAPTPLWVNQQGTPTSVNGVAFRTGSGTALAPPTGLTAVVN